VDSAQESAIANIMDLENVPFARIGVWSEPCFWLTSSLDSFFVQLCSMF
jgi:hypothetical protein